MIPDQPRRVVVAGDWHGNTMWAANQIRHILEGPLKHEPVKLILHLGDFGYGPDPEDHSYLTELHHELQAGDGHLDWIDGNHEHHPAIEELTTMWHDLDGPPRTAIPLPGHPRIRYLPRGTRWQWHNRTWLALGGAVSVDQAWRTPGQSWHPEETINPRQAAAIKAAGPADVIIAHDKPSGITLNLPPPHQSWLPYIPAAEAHSDLIQDICNTVQPKWYMHGHYHRAYSKPVTMPWGDMLATGLDCDGTQHNWHVLNTETMEWE